MMEEGIPVLREEPESIPLRKQWYFRSFVQNVLLLFVFIFMMSPVLTYLYFMGMTGVGPSIALMWTILHAIISFIVLFVDVIRSVWATTAKKYIFSMFFDSSEKWKFQSIELTDDRVKPLELTLEQLTELGHLPNPKPLPVEMRQEVMKKLESLRPGLSKGKLKGKIEDYVGSYNFFEVYPIGHEFFKHIWLIPKPHDFNTAFKSHREVTIMRYPIPTWVSYGIFTLMVTMDYEGETIPVYEVTYAPGLVRERQELLPWFNPKEMDVTKSLLRYDQAIGTKWKMAFENLLRYVKFLLSERLDAEEYGRSIANQLLKDAEMTGKAEEEQKRLTPTRTKIIIAVGILIIIILLILYGFGLI